MTKENAKKLAELVIYFDDFKFKVIILALFEVLNLNELTEDYAVVVRASADYDFVYLDKFFPRLKKFFFSRLPAEAAISPNSEVHTFDEENSSAPSETLSEYVSDPLSEEEIILVQGLKLHDYSHEELMELAVSFIHSELFEAARTAMERVIKENPSEDLYLRASYIRITCLLHQHDYRAALDAALEAAGKSKQKEDILSFLYIQAEAHLRLGNKKGAKTILEKVMSIDEGYRLTKQRLQRLNEI